MRKIWTRDLGEIRTERDRGHRYDEGKDQFRNAINDLRRKDVSRDGRKREFRITSLSQSRLALEELVQEPNTSYCQLENVVRDPQKPESC